MTLLFSKLKYNNKLTLSQLRQIRAGCICQGREGEGVGGVVVNKAKNK
jgi:hypothetical protein